VHTNYTAASGGMSEAVCLCCNKHSPPARVDSDGEPSLWNMPRGWSQAPLPSNYQHKDGSRGSTYTCPDCHKRLDRGETLTRRASESSGVKAVAP